MMLTPYLINSDYMNSLEKKVYCSIGRRVLHTLGDYIDMYMEWEMEGHTWDDNRKKVYFRITEDDKCIYIKEFNPREDKW